jgi:hypothetical protein
MKKLFIFLFIISILIMAFQLFIKLYRLNNYTANKKLYCFNKFTNFKQPAYIIIEMKDSLNYLKWCNSNTKVNTSPITFPFKYIGNGDSVYLLEKQNSKIYKVYYPDDRSYNSDIFYIWSGYLIDTFPFRGQKSRDDSLPELKHPSF